MVLSIVAVNLVFIVDDLKAVSRWDFDDDSGGWTALNQCELKHGEGILTVVSEGNDPHFMNRVNAPAGWKKLSIHARFTGRVQRGQLFWTTASSTSISEERSVRFEMRARDDQWHTYSAFFNPADTLTGIRIDPADRRGQIHIDWIALANEEPPAPQATSVADVRVKDGFKVELLYSVPTDQGSWVALTTDDKGRLITSDQYGKLYRIMPPAIGGNDSIQIERIDLEIGMAQGLLYAFDSLYVMVNGKGPQGAGLYRVTDSDGDDTFDSVKLLRKINGGGEHGPHAVVLSPDGKSIYVCGGNHTDIPDPETSRVPRHWGEDQLLPRMWDAGGHAVGKLAPGGWIAKTDPDGKHFELICSGFRNEYDIAFDQNGELFTYDADMEWDIGASWYRPTRVCHATSGAEFGWRSGTGKFPTWYPDSVPAVVDIGPGSPTGIVFGTGAKFPGKYQRALFICDWSYGVIYAVHMTPDGSTFAGEAERFISAAPLPATDIIVNPKDGAMYFTIGGRRTQSGLYRVTYTGDEPTAKSSIVYDAGQADRKLRHQLEALHVKGANDAVETAWPYLGHEDRRIRFAARIAIEHQPVEEWQDRAVTETDPQASLTALLALIRCGDASLQPAVLNALERFSESDHTPEQGLEALRVLSLCFIRMGEPDVATKLGAAGILERAYPTADERANRELCALLVYLDAPRVIERTLELIAAAPTQEEQLHYALCLRAKKTGWTPDQRRAYFAWFNKAASHRGGHSFSGFLKNIRAEAIETLTDDEKKTLEPILAAVPASAEPTIDLSSRKLIRKWTVAELLPTVEAGLGGRDYANGRAMFTVAACYKCHRFAGQGGIVGPDLTAVGRRFNSRNMLESLIEPSKEVSDQYQATVFLTESGRQIVGRVANLNGKNIMVMENMLDPGKLTAVNRDELEESFPSKTSQMPTSLLDTLTENEILDLIAYLRSGGDPNHEVFAK